MKQKRLDVIRPTGIERPWGDDELVVSKTDLKGRIIYANDVFQKLAQMSEAELIGKPHNIIRHPDMPRAVFKLLWDTLSEKKEIFAYVINMSLSGDHYWVFAHVTPTLNNAGHVVDYHSNRRKPTKAQVETIRPIYQALCDEERRHHSPKDALEASTRLLHETIKSTGMRYDQFIFSF